MKISVDQIHEYIKFIARGYFPEPKPESNVKLVGTAVVSFFVGVVFQAWLQKYLLRHKDALIFALTNMRSKNNEFSLAKLVYQIPSLEPVSEQPLSSSEASVRDFFQLSRSSSPCISERLFQRVELLPGFDALDENVSPPMDRASTKEGDRDVNEIDDFEGSFFSDMSNKSFWESVEEGSLKRFNPSSIASSINSRLPKSQPPSYTNRI